MMEVAIRVENLSKTFKIRNKSLGTIREIFANIISERGKREIRNEYKALINVNFEVYKEFDYGIYDTR